MTENNATDNPREPIDLRLHLATTLGNIATMTKLLDEGVDIESLDTAGRTPLLRAVEQWKTEEAKFLIEKGANINVQLSHSDTPLFHSVMDRGNTVLARFLMSKGADVNTKDKDGDTPLHYLVSRNVNLWQVDFLISEGADVNAKNQDSYTPLHAAAFNGNVDVIALLIYAGADVNAKENRNLTPLHYAIENGNLEAVKFLVSHGADVNAKDNNDHTPSHWAACFNKDITVISFLISTGADVHSKDKNGGTSLHQAAYNKNVEIAQFLVSAGADVHEKANDGETPLDVAKKQENTAVVEYLVSITTEPQTSMSESANEREPNSAPEFSTELLNCDTDLKVLTNRIMGLNGVNFSLCLYGVPGSGKSAYARFLAENLKMKVLHKRASDLFSKWLGESEQNIAAAFAEAKKEKMLLIFDEADSFLRDRRHAMHSWQVTQVNEMLTQMESHPLPFVCTTNLMDELDQASLRRFTFKVKYDFLTHSQVSSAFNHFFGAEPVVSLSELTCLVPGDFAVVAKKARIFGIDDHHELAAMLRQEQDVKDVKTNSIRFIVP